MANKQSTVGKLIPWALLAAIVACVFNLIPWKAGLACTDSEVAPNSGQLSDASYTDFEGFKIATPVGASFPLIIEPTEGTETSVDTVNRFIAKNRFKLFSIIMCNFFFFAWL